MQIPRAEDFGGEDYVPDSKLLENVDELAPPWVPASIPRSLLAPSLLPFSYSNPVVSVVSQTWISSSGEASS